MRCITIQNKEVYKELMEQGFYVKEKEYKNTYKDIKKAYKFMKDTYGFKYYPIFLDPVGYKVEFGGANFDKDSVAIELDIPNNWLFFQEYYEWSDFIYLIGNEKELNNYKTKYTDVYDYGRTILNRINTKEDIRESDVIQVSTQALMRETVIGMTENLERLEFLHKDSGGTNILNRLNQY